MTAGYRSAGWESGRVSDVGLDAPAHGPYGKGQAYELDRLGLTARRERPDSRA